MDPNTAKEGGVRESETTEHRGTGMLGEAIYGELDDFWRQSRLMKVRVRMAPLKRLMTCYIPAARPINEWY